MKKPVLVVMAAGMGSRYGGLKQIDPIDKDGDIIIDFSIYDAIQAGFEKIVFIIKKENEADFRAAIGDRMSKHIQVEFVFQDLHNLPEDSYIYCFKDEGCHIIYHRFLPEDYADFAF